MYMGTKYPFFTTDIAFAPRYTGVKTVRLAVFFNYPMFVHSRQEASEKLLGVNLYPSEKGNAGQYGPTEKAILEADDRVGDAAGARGMPP